MAHSPFTRTWNANDPVVWSQEAVRAISPPRNVRLHSSGVSGGVALLNLTPGGQRIAISGGLEVWVKIVHPGNIFEYCLDHCPRQLIILMSKNYG